MAAINFAIYMKARFSKDGKKKVVKTGATRPLRALLVGALVPTTEAASIGGLLTTIQVPTMVVMIITGIF